MTLNTQTQCDAVRVQGVLDSCFKMFVDKWLISGDVDSRKVEKDTTGVFYSLTTETEQFA